MQSKRFRQAKSAHRTIDVLVPSRASGSPREVNHANGRRAFLRIDVRSSWHNLWIKTSKSA
jgi:hypothetical protein